MLSHEDKIEEPSIEIKEITSSTDHEHFYIEGETHDDLKDVVCSCGHGMQINKDVEVSEGRILWNK